MPFVPLSPQSAPWKKLCRRVLISGPPNSGKTRSMETCPGRVAYVAYPGEFGSSTVDVAALEARGGKAWIWEAPPPGQTDWGKVRREITQITTDILLCKLGEFDTFFGDGLHKLYGAYLADITAGASESGDDFESKKYGPCHKAFFAELRRINASPIKNVFFAVWDGREKDDPEAKGNEAVTHIFPELPGAAAKMIMGEFSVVVWTFIKTLGAERKYLAQTRPGGKTWGCGIKAPQAVLDRVPLYIPQDWSALIELLDPTPAAVKE